MARILLVEDDKDQATTIEEWLSSEHHNVVISYDGEEGQYRIENDNFDVIVLDWVIVFTKFKWWTSNNAFDLN